MKLIFLILIIILSINKYQSQTLFDVLQDITTVIDDTNDFLMEYDFIIIGSGSAGSVLANRLTESKNCTVLLLEAGQQENLMTDVPLTSALTHITRYNWGYKTDPAANACLGLQNGVCNWPKGRALGGTSVINYLLYHRGHMSDFDEWSALGNYGWTYAEVLPYFLKSEKIGIPELMHSKYHSAKGYLDVQHSPYVTELLTAFIATGKAMGYKQTDPNGENMMGFSLVQATMKNGRRCSAAKSFLYPINGRRPNLNISMRSRVIKIVIDQLSKRATGVEFLKNKKFYRIHARKEVILSAGTIASPQLLMLSGIGPKEDLEKFGIPVVENLKVGYNLQDHVGLSGLVFLVNKPVTIVETNVQNPIDIFNYAFRGRGPFTSPGGAEGLAFIKLENSTLPNDYPDIEVVMGAGALTGDISGSMRNMLGITEEFFRRVYKGVIGKDAFALFPILLKPKSRGRISLKSKNPFAWPRMQPNYLDNSEDLDKLVEGTKLALEIGESKQFKALLGSKLHSRPFIGCDHLKFKSDDYWKCCIKRFTSSLQHQVGTCKMGPPDDPFAVVNPKLQVYGIQNLRVIDASIMPILPSAHTNAVVYMIGEKGADLIKSHWNL